MNLDKASEIALETWIGRAQEPGAIVGILQRGSVISWNAIGFATMDRTAEHLGLQSVFYVASLAKQFTGACAALAEDADMLRGQDQIRKYLPELSVAFDGVTIEQLLHHTAGTPKADPLAAALGLPVTWWDGRGLWDLIAVLKDAPALAAPPGLRHAYSNEGYWLLAAAIERASSVSFTSFARDRLFAPLRMYSSRFRDDPYAPQPNLVDGHAGGAGGLRKVQTHFHGVGDGGLLTNLEDLAQWDLFWSGNSALGPSIPARLRKGGCLKDGSRITYGWGVSVRLHRGLTIISHGGNYIGFLAKFVRFPDADLSVACLANRDDVNVDAIARDLADMALGDALDHMQPSWAETYREDARADV